MFHRDRKYTNPQHLINDLIEYARWAKFLEMNVSRLPMGKWLEKVCTEEQIELLKNLKPEHLQNLRIFDQVSRQRSTCYKFGEIHGS